MTGKKINLRGQAALEFLTTYGWAFLLILIMIGTLAYFGILSPGKLLPNRCNMGSEFQCVDFQIDATANGFKLKLKSNVGEPITVSKITLSSESTTPYTCTDPPTASPTTWTAGTGIVNWATGKTEDITWTGCNSAAAGVVKDQKTKVQVAISYYTVSSGSGYTKQVSGEVFATAQ